MNLIRSKRFQIIVIALLLAIFLSACGEQDAVGGSSYVDPNIPQLTEDTGWIVDMANGMSSETEKTLELMAQEIDARPEGYQMGIAIFSNSASDGIDVATEFGNENGIGGKENDNGITVVVFVDKEGGDGNAPAISVAIGSGLEGLLNDAKVGRILDKTYVPMREAGNWEQGLIDFVDGVNLVLDGADGEEFAPEPINWWLIIGIVLLIIVLVILDFIFFDGTITIIAISIASGGKGSGGSFSGGGSSR